MARLGVAPHVADKILNHQSGTISGVAAVYQRHEFLAERKSALEHWGSHLAALSHSESIATQIKLKPLTVEANVRLTRSATQRSN
jgi:hypothetical protein